MRVISAVLLPFLLGQGWAAPRTLQDSREDQTDNVRIRNPFSQSPENLRLLQDYLKEADPLELNASNLKRETVILHLFLLHDYDKNGRLDGLELMHFLHRILAHGPQAKPTHESVIRLVDEVLDKQDLNRDGLLSAPELVTPPIYTSEEDVSQESIAMVVPPPEDTQGLNSQNLTDSMEKEQGPELDTQNTIDGQDSPSDHQMDTEQSEKENNEAQEEPIDDKAQELLTIEDEHKEEEDEENQDLQAEAMMEDKN